MGYSLKSLRLCVTVSCLSNFLSFYLSVFASLREAFQNGKAQRSEKWRTAFAKGELGIKPGEEIPLYNPASWDKQRNHFPALDKPEQAAETHVYRFYQAASLHRHTLLRELLPKHNLIIV